MNVFKPCVPQRTENMSRRRGTLRSFVKVDVKEEEEEEEDDDDSLDLESLATSDECDGNAITSESSDEPLVPFSLRRDLTPDLKKWQLKIRYSDRYRTTDAEYR